MKEISSKANKNYKLCMQLALRKYRDKYGLYLVEGRNLFDEAARSGAETAAVFLRSDCPAPSFLDVPETYVLGKKLFDGIAQTETSQGIVAIVKKKHYSEREFFSLCGDKNVLVLDRLQDPGNIGTMIRTAEAAGYGGAVIMKETGDIYSPKAARAAAGSLFRLPVLFADTPLEALGVLKAHGKRAVATCSDAEACYYGADLGSGVALLIGNEGSGLCREFAEGADMKVKIPMAQGVDSLNAAVAAGILMYESRRGPQIPQTASFYFRNHKIGLDNY
ncbi:MAG: RNA methyltransferase [Clostridiales bacterium]|nr:RNA methyltransferase [Clostridiales bacterium]